MSGALAQSEALRHLERGWSILPCTGKRPNASLIRRTRGVAGWKTFQTRPADITEVCEWFRLEPASDIGIVCGDASRGLVVVDVDTPEAGPPALPATASVSTGRAGGRHHYLHASQSIRTTPYAWGEVRANGSYVVAPASIHAASGRRYEWIATPEQVGIAAVDEIAQPWLATIRTTCSVGSYLAGPRDARTEKIAIEQARAMGAAVGYLGQPFECLLHRDGRASATLWRADPAADVLYHDWHVRSAGDVWLPLPVVRAKLAGRDGRISGPELAVWRLRLEYDAGQLEPIMLAERSRLPADCEPYRELWRAFLLLIGLRWTRQPGDAAPYSVRFASSWSGISAHEAHAGLRQLARRGVLELHGHDANGNRLWLPGRRWCLVD